MASQQQAEPGYLRLLDGLTQVANICGTLLIVGLMLLIGADVFMRNVFDAPVSGVPEMVTLSIVAIVFLQAPQALKAGRMTRSDALINFLSTRAPGVCKGLEALYDLLGLGVILAVMYATWPILVKSWQRNDFIGAVGDFTAPTWPVKAMIMIGCALLALQFVARIIRRRNDNKAGNVSV